MIGRRFLLQGYLREFAEQMSPSRVPSTSPHHMFVAVLLAVLNVVEAGRKKKGPPPPPEFPEADFFTTAVVPLMFWGILLALPLLVLFGKRTPPKAKAGPKILVLPDAASVPMGVCNVVAEAAAKAIKKKGSFNFAVCGGPVLDSLSKLKEHTEVDWKKATLAFVDHECHPPTEADATCTLAKKKFAAATGIGQIIEPPAAPAKGTDGAAEAKAYAAALAKATQIPRSACGSYPVFDLLLLGLGNDGSVGSIGPLPSCACGDNCGCGDNCQCGPYEGADYAFNNKQKQAVVAAAAHTPKGGKHKASAITLSLEAINCSPQPVFVCVGDAQRHAVKRAVVRPAEARGAFPAQAVKSPLLMCDPSAAYCACGPDCGCGVDCACGPYDLTKAI